MIPLHVQISFVEVDFESDLFPSDFAVGFWVAWGGDAAFLFFRSSEVLVGDVFQVGDYHVVVVYFLDVDQLFEPPLEGFPAVLVFLVFKEGFSIFLILWQNHVLHHVQFCLKPGVQGDFDFLSGL